MPDLKTAVRGTLLVLTMLLFFPAPALAHKVYLFAWVEGDRVYVDAYFSKSRKVQHGTITVKTPDGEVLLTGETDENGAMSFPVPRKTDLHLHVEAGTGHVGDFVLTADELPDAAGSGEAPAAPAPVSAAEPATERATAAAPPPTSPASPEMTATLKQLMEKMDGIDRRLATLERGLAESRREKEPGLQEIVGGIGWILGIMGMFLYARSRKG